MDETRIRYWHLLIPKQTLYHWAMRSTHITANRKLNNFKWLYKRRLSYTKNTSAFMFLCDYIFIYTCHDIVLFPHLITTWIRKINFESPGLTCLKTILTYIDLQCYLVYSLHTQLFKLTFTCDHRCYDRNAKSHQFLKIPRYIQSWQYP